MASDTPTGGATYTTGAAPRRTAGAPLTGVAEERISTFEELDARVSNVGSVLFILADMFYFASWLFAFFYLKSLNNNHAWLPKGVHHPNAGFDGLVVALVVVSALAVFIGSRPAGGASPLYRILAPIGFILGLAAVVLGVWRLWHLGFGMTQGGYASVYVGFWGSVIFHVAAAMAWLATNLMQIGPERDAALRPASIIGFGRILLFIAGAAIVAYLVLDFAA